MMASSAGVRASLRAQQQDNKLASIFRDMEKTVNAADRSKEQSLRSVKRAFQAIVDAYLTRLQQQEKRNARASSKAKPDDELLPPFAI